MSKPSAFSSGFSQAFGVGSYHYELSPWQWINEGLPRWDLGPLVVGRIDLRPLPLQVEGATAGLAFTASLQPQGGIAIANALHMSEESATSGMQDAWQAATGYRPQGATLAALLADQLTNGSSPDGLSGPRPLMPTTGGILHILVQGHSEVWREEFRFGIHPHTGKVRDVLRRNFERQWEASNGNDHCRRVLDFTCKKYKVDDWKEFVPQRLQSHVPGRLPHQTTITDNFNRTDADPPSNSAEGWSWTEVAGSSALDTNEIVRQSGAATLRAEIDLSSDDQYAQCIAKDENGPCCRFASGANTFYTLEGGNNRIFKVVAGGITVLADGGSSSSALMRLEVDGSDLEGFEDGVSDVTVTDTAITGNLRAGLYVPAGRVDTFEAGDLGGGGGDSRARLIGSDLLHSPLINGALIVQ